MTTPDINLGAVLVSAVAGMVVGGVWYSPLAFSKPWLSLSGRKDMTPGEGAGVGYVIAFIGTLLMSYVLARFIGYAGATSAAQGAEIGFWAWLGLVGPAFLTTYTFSARPRKLWGIDAGCYLVTFLVMGLILGAWH